MNLEKVKKDNLEYIDAYFKYLNDIARGDNDLFFIYKELFIEKINECVKEYESIYNNEEVIDTLNSVKQYCKNLYLKYKESPDETKVYFYNKDNIFIGEFEDNGEGKWTISKDGINVVKKYISDKNLHYTFVYSKICEKYISFNLEERLKDKYEFK